MYCVVLRRPLSGGGKHVLLSFRQTFVTTVEECPVFTKQSNNIANTREHAESHLRSTKFAGSANSRRQNSVFHWYLVPGGWLHTQGHWERAHRVQSKPHATVSYSLIKSKSPAISADHSFNPFTVWNDNSSFLAAVGEVIVPRAHIMVRPTSGHFFRSQIEVRSSVIQLGHFTSKLPCWLKILVPLLHHDKKKLIPRSEPLSVEGKCRKKNKQTFTHSNSYVREKVREKFLTSTTMGFLLALDWLRIQHLHLDWFKQVDWLL